MTPEGAEKLLVKTFLRGLGAYQFWPVQTGVGVDTLDCLACISGTFWGIEVKAEGQKATKRQLIRMEQIEAAGGKTVVGNARTIISIIQQFVTLRNRAVP